MAEMRTGRCLVCQKRARFKHAIVYRWKRGRGMELHRAHCTYCGSRLTQTTFNNLKDPIVRDTLPNFQQDPTSEELIQRQSIEGQVLYRALKKNGIVLDLANNDDVLRLYQILDDIADQEWMLRPYTLEAAVETLDTPRRSPL